MIQRVFAYKNSDCYDAPVFSTVLLASILLAAVASLLSAIRFGDRPLEVISKATASAAFVTLGALRWSDGDTVGIWLLAALFSCAIGDVLLLGRHTFEIGLGCFLVAHLLFIFGFRAALPIHEWSLLALVFPVFSSAAAAAWLWSRLGRYRGPVIAYIVVITMMVWAGVSATASGRLWWAVAIGVVLFYLSDFAVARQRFVQPSFINRAFGLLTYYAAQFLLALTIGA
jgi:uncharacterized membrane protein YhhN